MHRVILALSALACTLCLSVARADAIADGLNSIRQRGCAGKPGVKATFKENRALGDVAREWSKGGRLKHALERARFRASSSASMRVEGSNDERAIVEILERQYCEIILDPAHTDIGVYRRGKRVWVVVAAPLKLPGAGDADRIAAQVLELVNRARARPRKCGSESFAAAAPLTLSAELTRAALQHAKDMAARESFSHRGSDGSLAAERVTRAGYRWQNVGENIALDAPDAQTVVQGWLDSPGHCANIMNGDFTQMGVAYASNPKGRHGLYWAQVFARPR
jgi:uncharacterized protein YkwD